MPLTATLTPDFTSTPPFYFIQLLKFPNKFHHRVKVKWQFLLAPVFVWTCCPRCFSLGGTTLVRAWMAAAGKLGTRKLATGWKLIIAESLCAHPGWNLRSTEVQESVTRAQILYCFTVLPGSGKFFPLPTLLILPFLHIYSTPPKLIKIPFFFFC